jgi:hypothetical protein
MSRIALTLAGAALALATTTGPAHSDGAVHELYPEEWEGTEAFAAGDGPCVGWAGTFHETRTGGYRVVAAPGGRVDGELHVNGQIGGQVDLVPDDPTLPAYHGDYREKVNGVITGFDEEEGDLARVAQFRLRVPLTGTDGSRIVLVMSGKLTENAAGTVTVDRQRFDCLGA